MVKNDRSAVRKRTPAIKRTAAPNSFGTRRPRAAASASAIARSHQTKGVCCEYLQQSSHCGRGRHVHERPRVSAKSRHYSTSKGCPRAEEHDEPTAKHGRSEEHGNTFSR